MFDFFRYPHTDLNQQNLDWLIEEMKGLISDYKNFKNPEVAHSADEMTNKNKIYVYIGNESEYLSNYWYYYDTDTNAWTAGGRWGDNELTLDTTLTSTTEPAQGKAVGDAIDSVQSNVNTISGNVSDNTSAINRINSYVSDIRTQSITSNRTDFTFTNLLKIENTGIYKYGILCGGPNPGCVYLVFVGTDGTVTLTPIVAITGGITLTGTVDTANYTMTINASATVYGGLRIIWIN